MLLFCSSMFSFYLPSKCIAVSQKSKRSTKHNKQHRKDTIRFKRRHVLNYEQYMRNEEVTFLLLLCCAVVSDQSCDLCSCCHVTLIKTKPCCSFIIEESCSKSGLAVYFAVCSTLFRVWTVGYRFQNTIFDCNAAVRTAHVIIT